MILGLFIILVCSCLLVYWMARVLLLLSASPQAIDEKLAYDEWRCREFLLGLRTTFLPPQSLVG